MTDEAVHLELVGESLVERVLEVASHHHRLLSGPTAGIESAIEQLDQLFLHKRAKLEEALTGVDSFDTLAFLRMFISPSDFAEARESESQIERSDAALQVVALTLLSIGLPRSPLRGEDSVQPSPALVLGLAADIIRVATTRLQLMAAGPLTPLARLPGCSQDLRSLCGAASTSLSPKR